MRELWRRLMFLAHRGRFESELEEEMRFHLEMAGPRKFGNFTYLREESREMWGWGWLERLAQDARYGLRMMRKTPVFTAVAVASLALGIGANTAIFSLIDAVMLRPLAVRDPGRLVMLSRSNLGNAAMSSFPYPFYRELRGHSRLIADAVCVAGMSPSLSVNGSAERVSGEMVSGNYFQALGVQPYAGCLFRPDDEHAPGADRVAVLSYGFWKRRFGGDMAVIGTSVRLNTIPMTVIGISPPEFGGLNMGSAPEVRVPITMQAEMETSGSTLEERGDWWLNIIGRLKPGVQEAQAAAEATAMVRAYMEGNRNGKPRSEFAARVFATERMNLLPAKTGLPEGSVKKSALSLYVLMAVVGMVLLIACVNIANLLLARTAARQREIAVRLALGATRGRLVRQLVTESLLLCGIGGLAGVLFAQWGARVMLAFMTGGQRGVSIDVSPDARVLAFTLAVSLLTGLLFGLGPALQSTRPAVARELKGGGIEWRKALVSAQVGLSLVLLIGAGLFLRSLLNLERMDTGFDRSNVLVLSLDPSQSGYTNNQIKPFYREVAKAVQGIPGVEATAYSRQGLVAGSQWGTDIQVEGYRRADGERGPLRDMVSPGYFQALKIPILLGREFEPRDSEKALHVAIVNESFARFYFGAGSPIGKHIGPTGSKADFSIVGVARDGKYSSMRQETPRFWYIPYEQQAEVHRLRMFVRTTQNPAIAAETIRKAIQKIDSRVPVYDVGTLQEQVNENLATDRMVASLSGFFSFVAAMMAAIGLYGVMRYSVARRTREIGIRMALGAQQSDVIRAVMREVVLFVSLGLALGVPCALALGKYVRSLLYGVVPSDSVTLGAAVLAMGAVALMAGYLPALKAAKVDPVVALRYE